MPRRLRLEGESLDAVLAQARRLHGPDARIVSAERVITGGFKGLFGRQHYEVVVEVGDAPPRTAVGPVRFPAARRAGIAALLDDADEGDALRPTPSAAVEVSTRGDDFAALLDELVAETAEPPPAAVTAPPAPVSPLPRAAPGDLVALVGLAADVVPAARALAQRQGLLMACAGSATDDDTVRVDDRRAATEARARGVRAARATVVAVGVRVDAVGVARVLDELGAEQVAVVVDASRKPADTERWVAEVQRLVLVRAMVVVGRELTATPDSVLALGLPELRPAG